jgi:two-component system, OmpR family, response regulator
MPGGGGSALLQSLRQCGVATTAIATSAELDVLLRNELIVAGYAAALTKPISFAQLGQLLSTHLPGWRTPVHPVSAAAAASISTDLLDDEAALISVGGDADILRALRALLVQDLRSIAPRLSLPMFASSPEMRDWLHRLRASCRYCGVSALADAAQRLESLVGRSAASSELELSEFLSVCERSIDALDAAAAETTHCDHASSAPL